MKYAYLVLAFLLLSCAVREQDMVTDTSAAVEPGQEAVPDDPIGGSETLPIDDAPAMEAPPLDPVPTNEEAAPRFMDRYLALTAKMQYYAFDYDYIGADDKPATVVVFRMDDWQVIDDNTWEVNTTTRKLIELTEARSKQIGKENERKRDGDVRYENVTHAVVDYIWMNLTTGEAKACWIDPWLMHTSNGYNSEDCTNYDHENESERVVYEHLTLDRELRLPEHWLQRFKGREPLEVTEGMTFRDKDRDYLTEVDRVEFSTGVTTTAVLYLHAGYGIPLEVELTKDNKVVERITYKHMTINYPVTKRWYPRFLLP